MHTRDIDMNKTAIRIHEVFHFIFLDWINLWHEMYYVYPILDAIHVTTTDGADVNI